VTHHFRAVDIEATWPSLQAQNHPLGVDDVGRDVLARLIHGTRVSMAVGFISVGISMVIGVVLGALAGYFRGAVDAVIMRIVEVVLCFPTIFLILMLLAFLPRSVFMVMVVIGLTSWTSATRLIRGEFFKQREMEYAMAGRALGMSPWRLMFRHILPNSVGPVLVVATFGVASAILLESVLTFLGLGAGPETPSWGEMLSQGRENTLGRWFLVVFPGVAIFVNVLAFNLVGDGLRDAIDPRLRV
jgi:peptide/nickel transport system permease protein